MSSSIACASLIAVPQPSADYADRAGNLDEVAFTFNTITWTWVDGGTTHTDTWSTNQ